MTRLAYILASLTLLALASGCCCSPGGGFGGYSGYSGYPAGGGNCPSGQCGPSYGPTYAPQSYPSAALPAYNSTANANTNDQADNW